LSEGWYPEEEEKARELWYKLVEKLREMGIHLDDTGIWQDPTIWNNRLIAYYDATIEVDLTKFKLEG